MRIVQINQWKLEINSSKVTKILLIFTANVYHHEDFKVVRKRIHAQNIDED